MIIFLQFCLRWDKSMALDVIFWVRWIRVKDLDQGCPIFNLELHCKHKYLTGPNFKQPLLTMPYELTLT